MIIITKKKIIKEMAKLTQLPVRVMTEYFQLIEQYVNESLAKVRPGEDVEIKLLNGLSIIGVYDEKSEQKIKITAKITPGFDERVNERRLVNKAKEDGENKSNGLFGTKTIKCVSCGKLFEVSKYSKSCRCKECQHEHKKEYDKSRIYTSRNTNVVYV